MKPIWRFITSIRLTIYLLTASVLLIFFGTLDQVKDGIYLTQQRYFEHLFVVWQFPLQWGWSDALGWIHIPLPGGYLLGPLLVLNLLAAHFRYYRHGWKKIGIGVLHLGVVVLLLGQLIAQVAQEDNYLWLAEGQQSNYLESFQEDELVIIDKSDPDYDRVYAWPTTAFSGRPTALRQTELPFIVDVKGYLINASIFQKGRFAQAPDLQITQGIGAARNLTAIDQAPTYADGERNRTTAIVDIRVGESTLGRWMISNAFRPNPGTPFAFPPQTFVYQGRTYEIALRHKRTYLPAHIKLLNFSHDRYPGTQIPVNFSSTVSILDDQSGTERTNLIYMNHPMRFAGFTFYQASFANKDTMSMFQVVRNPGRWVPYIACVMISLGMLWQFLWSLWQFIRRSRQPNAS